jgi:hypothetical protein
MSLHHHDWVDLVQVSADYAKNGVNYSEKYIITLVSGYVIKAWQNKYHGQQKLLNH